MFVKHRFYEQKVKKLSEKDIEKVMKVIAEAWKETIEHFGEDNPFKDNLKFIIKDDGSQFPGKIILEKKDRER